MNIRLFSNAPPSGRALLLVKALEEVTDLGPRECLETAQRLFDGQFSKNNPVNISVRAGAELEPLLSLCERFGIIAEQDL
jgi:hypothetical protein